MLILLLSPDPVVVEEAENQPPLRWQLPSKRKSRRLLLPLICSVVVEMAEIIKSRCFHMTSYILR